MVSIQMFQCFDFQVDKWLRERGVSPVSFDNWEEIDKKEKENGEISGKPREKFVDIKTMVSVLMGTQSWCLRSYVRQIYWCSVTTLNPQYATFLFWLAKKCHVSKTCYVVNAAAMSVHYENYSGVKKDITDLILAEILHACLLGRLVWSGNLLGREGVVQVIAWDLE